MDEIIDSNSITDSKADIRYRNGYAFSLVLRVSSGIFAVLGLIAIISGGAGYILGPIFVLTGIYVNTSTYGTEISLSNNYIRIYSTSFGVKKGKWQSTVLLPDICILKIGRKTSASHIFGAGSVQLEDDGVYEVYLLTANHRERLLLRETKEGKEAAETGRFLAVKMKKNLTTFNPVISERTKTMRYERH